MLMILPKNLQTTVNNPNTTITEQPRRAKRYAGSRINTIIFRNFRIIFKKEFVEIISDILQKYFKK